MDSKLMVCPGEWLTPYTSPFNWANKTGYTWRRYRMVPLCGNKFRISRDSIQRFVGTFEECKAFLSSQHLEDVPYGC